MILSRRYKFEVADRIQVGDRRKCWDIGGVRFVTHKCVLKIRIWGEVARDGTVARYEAIDATVKPILKLVDGRDLNSLHERCSTTEAQNVSDLPTLELLAEWFKVRLPLLNSVRSPGADLPTALRLETIIVEEDDDSSVEEWIV